MGKIRVKAKLNEMTKADVQWVSLVERPASRAPFRITKSETDETDEGYDGYTEGTDVVQKQGRQVHGRGVGTARAAIRGGRVNTTSPWSFTAADGNRLLGPGGNNFARFGSVHLAVNTGAPEDTKRRYSFPVAKLVAGRIIVFRSGVRAARTRAAQVGETAVSQAARRLLDEMDRRGQKSEYIEIEETTMEKLKVKLAGLFGSVRRIAATAT